MLICRVPIWKENDPSVDGATAGASRRRWCLILMLTRKRTHYWLCHLLHLRQGWHIPKTKILIRLQYAEVHICKFEIYCSPPRLVRICVPPAAHLLLSSSPTLSGLCWLVVNVALLFLTVEPAAAAVLAFGPVLASTRAPESRGSGWATRPLSPAPLKFALCTPTSSLRTSTFPSPLSHLCSDIVKELN